MMRDERSASALPMRILLIASAATVMAAVVVTLPRLSLRRAGAADSVSVAVVVPASRAIAMEALVFRTPPASVALGPTARRRATAHLRTLATYRGLRAYPGAPPRVPHGLTADESRGNRCNTCHQRGGYSQRFEAYAPLTPHPEMANCLQCHVADAALVGISLPGSGPDALCRQCHAPAASRLAEPAVDWRPVAWPRVQDVTRDESPPAIPHSLEMRGNCLACHMGPSAVAGIRTPHPERANCRQCHLTSSDDDGVFTRPGAGAAPTRGGPP